MKKGLAFLLALCMAATLLSGCAPTTQGTQGSEKPTQGTANSETPGVSKEDPTKVAVILQVGGLGDQGYNDAAAAGMKEMEETFNVKGTLVEAVAPAEADTFVRQLAEDGYPLIICLDWGIIDHVKTASLDYPDTMFAVLGRSLPGTDGQKNLVQPFTALHERGFLAAVVSMLFAKDGNEIIDGVGKPGCTVSFMMPGESVNANRNRSVYQQARDLFCPEAKIVEEYTVSKTDSALNATITENLIKNQDVEVFWPNIGVGSLGVYTACKANQAFALGIDINQDSVEPGTLLTSTLHDTHAMVRNIVTEFMNGTLTGENAYYWGLDSGVVGITDMATLAGLVTNKENFDRVKAEIEAIEKKVIDGDIVVYNFFLEDQVPYEDWKAAHPGVDYTEWVKAGRP